LCEAPEVAKFTETESKMVITGSWWRENEDLWFRRALLLQNEKVLGIHFTTIWMY
jgi:hypothetical protein